MNKLCLFVPINVTQLSVRARGAHVGLSRSDAGGHSGPLSPYLCLLLNLLDFAFSHIAY